VRLTVNGVEQEVESPPLATLLTVLREELGITSPKAGCEQGGCGACTVLVGGEARRACLLPLVALDGSEVTTVEGLGTPERLSRVQAAFNEHYAAQCGYCTSGMLMAAEALLRATSSPTRADIERALSGHVCRCTGYVKIIEAIEGAASREALDLNRHLPREQEGPDVEIKGAPA
jgi:aerobic-type carbon monoxide dehydrogenase small subunit (CoxS/CutS family)